MRYLITVALIFGMAVFFAAGSDLFLELLLPLAAMSLVLGAFVSNWLGGKRDTFDPLCMLGIFGLHFFMFGPLFQIRNNYFPYIAWSDDLQKWTIVWFYTQAAFLILVMVGSGLVDRNPSEDKVTGVEANRRVAAVCVLATGVAKMATFAYFGGVSGLINAYEARIQQGILENNPFAGIGPLVLTGDMFPIALGLYAILANGKKVWFQRPVVFAAFMTVMLVITVLTVGLRGSRSSVVFALAIILLAYHSYVRRMPRGILVGGAVAVTVFMQGYMAYKFGGIDALLSPERRTAMLSERQLDDELSFVLIRDFTRMDVQVYAMRAMLEGEQPYAYGRTLVGGVLSVMPSAIFPGRPDTFVKEKTEIMYPGRTYTPRGATTLVFGGFGELFVNFGWMSVMLGVPFGVLLKRASSYVSAVSVRSVRRSMLLPILCLFPIAVLVYDSNSLLYFAIQFCTIPMILYSIRPARKYLSVTAI